MKILVVGSGGREHALCRSFQKSEKVEKIFCASGNAGIGEIAELVAIKHDEIERLADFALTLLRDEEEGQRQARFVTWVTRDLLQRETAEVAATYRLAAPFEQLWPGLARYWEKAGALRS